MNDRVMMQIVACITQAAAIDQIPMYLRTRGTLPVRRCSATVPYGPRGNDDTFTARRAMIDDMGTFRTIVRVAHVARPDEWRELSDVMVDTGSEYNWIPAVVLADLGVTPERVERFETADGSVIERDIAFALLAAGGRATATIVVFAGEGDMVLLGAIGLEGMNLRVDLVARKLVPAGPVPVASAWRRRRAS
jgi:predicted aspartyl protease